MSTTEVSANCADEGWLEDPWTGDLRVTTLVLEGLRFLPAKMSSKDGAPQPMLGVFVGKA